MILDSNTAASVSGLCHADNTEASTSTSTRAARNPNLDTHANECANTGASIEKEATKCASANSTAAALMADRGQAPIQHQQNNRPGQKQKQTQSQGPSRLNSQAKSWTPSSIKAENSQADGNISGRYRSKKGKQGAKARADSTVSNANISGGPAASQKSKHGNVDHVQKMHVGEPSTQAPEDDRDRPQRRNRNKARPKKSGKSVGGGRKFNGALTSSTADIYDQQTSGDEKPEEPLLCTSLAQQLTKGLYECMICCDSVRARHAVWQCDTCWAIFHLGCVKKWARTSTAGAVDGGRWRCPGCQHTRAAAPSHYVCFCGAARDPEQVRRGAVPHTCGRICGRRRGAYCPHPCPLPCHPGPCPPCTSLAPEQFCFCGRVSFRARCGSDYDPATSGHSCGAVCGEMLGCGSHMCTKPCHEGLCAPCPSTVTQSCRCGRHTRQAPCGAPALYRCDEVCGEPLACGAHVCDRVCHGPDEGHSECVLDPSVATACHCGAHSVADLGVQRSRCTDPVPSCGEPCGKSHADCGHACLAPCHQGPCPPCAETVTTMCRCNSEQITAACGSPALCSRMCTQKRSCRRHRCSNRCCPKDDTHHACNIVCGRQLSCKHHRCSAACHSGLCPPCAVTSPEPLVCDCGRTRVSAPVPCGTALPPCRFPCQRSRECGHISLITHECHPSDTPCPPCPVLVATQCMCGARKLQSIPCHRTAAASCGRICDRLLPCGGHKCMRSCHRPDEPCLQGVPCRQRCGKPRKTCGHPCALTCHSPSMCDESQPCEALVDVSCVCGRITTRQRCGATLVNPRRRPVLDCDELCRVAERNRRVALALGLPERAEAPLEGLARVKYSDEILQFVRTNAMWVRDIEALVSTFVADRSRVVLNFSPMRSHQRAFLHAVAPIYGCSSRSIDREPVRSVCWDRTPNTTVPSILPSSAVRYARAPTVLCSDQVFATDDGDFDDSSSHIFEPTISAVAPSSSMNSTMDRLRRKFDYIAISDLRHGLTVDELRAAIGRLLPPNAPYTVRWKDEDLVEMHCTDAGSKYEHLAKWESLLKKKLPHTGTAGLVTGEKNVCLSEDRPPLTNSRLPKPQVQAQTLVQSLSLLATTTDAATECSGNVATIGTEAESDREIPENWESIE
ncbi:FKBP12-associated protein [Coemansia sp. RSA 485]|nr:FKBP12-associated protein [Coemansia sp. RSA 485]